MRRWAGASAAAHTGGGWPAWRLRALAGVGRGFAVGGPRRACVWPMQRDRAVPVNAGALGATRLDRGDDEDLARRHDAESRQAVEHADRGGARAARVTSSGRGRRGSEVEAGGVGASTGVHGVAAPGHSGCCCW